MIATSLITGFVLILAGLYGALTNRDIIRMIVAFTIADTGVNIVLVAVGMLPGREAPILDTIAPVGRCASASSIRCRRRWS